MITRFNNETFEQLLKYRGKHKIKGAIYGTPLTIAETVPLKTNVIVFETNIQSNKIEGIGVVYNYLRVDKYHRIYMDNNYNRYTYYGKLRIPRCDFTREEMVLVEKIEKIVFRGKGHLKRGQGIQQITRAKYTKDDLECFKQMIRDHSS